MCVSYEYACASVREGIALWTQGLSPYSGDVFHEVRMSNAIIHDQVLTDWHFLGTSHNLPVSRPLQSGGMDHRTLLPGMCITCMLYPLFNLNHFLTSFSSDGGRIDSSMLGSDCSIISEAAGMALSLLPHTITDTPLSPDLQTAVLQW